MLSFLRRAWDTLTTRPETPLNAVADQETVEMILDRMTRLQREIATLQFEWAETLDKLTVQASRFSARQRKRSQREIDAMAEIDQGEEDHAPPVPPVPPVPSLPLTKMQRIQQQIAQRRAGGA